MYGQMFNVTISQESGRSYLPRHTNHVHSPVEALDILNDLVKWFLFTSGNDSRTPSEDFSNTMEAIISSLHNPKEHTMGEALHTYVFQRIHQEIQRNDWREIRVIGSLQRNPPAVKAVWETHRPARPFNFQRPTVLFTDDGTLELHCFPSRSFVEHYKMVVAIYLALRGSRCILSAISPPLSEPLRIFRQSRLSQLGPADIAIFGDVDCLSKLPPGQWWKVNRTADDLFAWQKYCSSTGKTIALLGCKEGFWGEAGSAIIYALKEMSQIECAVYVGKVGALNGEYTPNEWIATGNEAYLGNRSCSVKWRNPLESSIRDHRGIATGKLVTVSSPLYETHGWLQQWDKTATWVDCDTGHMAVAAEETKVQFGYLHIVSDCLAAKYKDNLSNEDDDSVKERRQTLYRRIEDIITTFVSS
ncbi:hypothetical protein LZ32DRAFT_652025 [Colletotrichum eremochloae]|nr:hypothetical protein LZ32DRAFT_652025 [Colletotrichum eremochloae]